jgi:hypothetical protein
VKNQRYEILLDCPFKSSIVYIPYFPRVLQLVSVRVVRRQEDEELRNLCLAASHLHGDSSDNSSPGLQAMKTYTQLHNYSARKITNNTKII